jgi:hypothetical protein
VNILLIVLVSTSAIAEQTPFPIESPEALTEKIILGPLKDVPYSQGVWDIAQNMNIKTSSDAAGDRSNKNKSTFSEKAFDFGLGVGYRVDDLDWSIAGNSSGTSPNILSELTWNDLEILQLKADARIVLDNFPYVRGYLAYGSILKGENQDSDYSGDDRTFEWSRSNNSSNDGDVLDASGGIGYRARSASGKIMLAGLVGYSYHEQNLTMTNGYQTVSEPAFAPPGITPIPIGPFSGLNSTYETEWKGPWLGADLSYRPNEKWFFIGSFEYHWADFYAEANWNLRSDLAHPKSFEHKADGNGIVLSLVCDYYIRPNISLNLGLDYQDWSTDPGVDTVFFSNGTVGGTRLNEVNWESGSIRLGLTVHFKGADPNKLTSPRSLRNSSDVPACP